GVQTCALPISSESGARGGSGRSSTTARSAPRGGFWRRSVFSRRPDGARRSKPGQDSPPPADRSRPIPSHLRGTRPHPLPNSGFTMPTRILGISAFYHDSAAALVVDGEIVAAAQEERFTRRK